MPHYRIMYPSEYLNAGDEMAFCQGCHERFYYERLTEEGYCEDCAPEKVKEDEVEE